MLLLLLLPLSPPSSPASRHLQQLCALFRLVLLALLPLVGIIVPFVCTVISLANNFCVVFVVLGVRLVAVTMFAYRLCRQRRHPFLRRIALHKQTPIHTHKCKRISMCLFSSQIHIYIQDIQSSVAVHLCVRSVRRLV